MLQLVSNAQLAENSVQLTFSKDLGRFLFRDTLDLLERTTSCICNGLDSVVAAIDKKLDVALRQSCHTLCCVNSTPYEFVTLWMFTSKALSGVGAPGPPGPASSSMP